MSCTLVTVNNAPPFFMPPPYSHFIRRWKFFDGPGNFTAYHNNVLVAQVIGSGISVLYQWPPERNFQTLVRAHPELTPLAIIDGHVDILICQAITPSNPGKWSCLNGQCIEIANGIFNTLAECQTVCKPFDGKPCNCPPPSVCFSEAEMKQLSESLLATQEKFRFDYFAKIKGLIDGAINGGG